MTTPKAWNQDAYDEHPSDCSSLLEFKFFHPGGRCCATCYEYCTDCGAAFYIEGLQWLNHNDADAETEVWLCDCCKRRRTCLKPGLSP